MWGPEQEEWLFTEAFSDLADDEIILFINETSWWRFPEGDYDVTDKPAAYPRAQDRFESRLKGIGDYSSYPSIIDRFVWIGGDRHYCGYLSRDAAPSGFPQFIGSGWFQHSLKLAAGEAMDWHSPTALTSRDYDKWLLGQYMHLAVDWNPATKTLALSGQARVSTNNYRLLPSVTTTAGSTTVTSDSDHPFQSDDVGRAIVGRHLQGCPRILEVAAGGGGATVSSADGVTTGTAQGTIIYEPDEWRMSDQPSSPTILTWDFS